jgi:hypothetical protein
MNHLIVRPDSDFFEPPFLITKSAPLRLLMTNLTNLEATTSSSWIELKGAWNNRVLKTESAKACFFCWLQTL